MAVLSFSVFGIEISPLLFSKVGSELTQTIREAICYNQGRYIEFEFTSGNKHKALKTALNKGESSDEINRKYSDLVDYIYNTVKYNISEKNFQYILECDKLIKKSILPMRVCIKVGFGDKIFDYVRNETMYVNEPHLIERNTGFKYVKDNGKYYLCNNIPLQAKDGFYDNPRLNKRLVQSYKPPKKKIFEKEKIDVEWCNCWVVGDPPPAGWERSCYKSTMIIPMTLINNDLSEEFKKNFFPSPPPNNRTIVGFLCFDHPTTNYFREDIDIRLGYIFADILSLYFYSAYIHTTISETFQKAKELLEEKGGREWDAISPAKMMLKLPTIT